MQTKKFLVATFLGAGLALAACGGGSSSDSRVKNAVNSRALSEAAATGASTSTTLATRRNTVPTLPKIKPRPATDSTTATTRLAPIEAMTPGLACRATAFECGLNAGQAPFVVLAFGDSYGSGEGNPAGAKPRGFDLNNDDEFEDIDTATYESQSSLQEWWWEFTNVGGSRQPKFASQGVDAALVATSWVCHRSSSSGVAKAIDTLLARYRFNVRFGHFACSGAKSQHIVADSYTPEFHDFPLTVSTQVSQSLSWLMRQGLNREDVNAVVVSIGGNDVGFGDVIYDCFIEAGDCHNESDTIGLRDSIATKIPRAVDNVHARMRALFPNAQILFTAYTDGISVSSTNSNDLDNDGVCSYEDDPWTGSVEYDDDEFWDLRADDAVFVRDFLDRINSTLASAIAGKASTVLVDRQFTGYRNNGFCTRDRRNITFNDEAVARQGADQVHASSGGWHPNDRGYGMYGEAISQKLIDLFGSKFATYRR
jgi:hypothetical protein